MMLHQPTALLALRGGLMPLLMHNALRDTRLPSYADLRRLEYRCRVLHKRVLETSGLDGAVWQAMEDAAGGKETAAALAERLLREKRGQVALEESTSMWAKFT